jgi:hypothetical protein
VIRFEADAEDAEEFSEGSKLVKCLAKLLNLSSTDAHAFWQMFRNGIAHRALPKLYKGRSYELAAQSVPVRVFETHFVIDPLRLRDLVVGHEVVGEPQVAQAARPAS